MLALPAVSVEVKLKRMHEARSHVRTDRIGLCSIHSVYPLIASLLTFEQIHFFYWITLKHFWYQYQNSNMQVRLQQSNAQDFTQKTQDFNIFLKNNPKTQMEDQNSRFRLKPRLWQH